MTIGRSTAVGAFVLGGLAIAVVAILMFGGGRLLTTNLRVVVIFRDSIAGLSVGAPVTLRGVKIGTVRSMKIYVRLPDLVPVIPVYLEIDPAQVSWAKGGMVPGPTDFDMAIKAGLRAQLTMLSFVTGQLNVNLDFRPDTPATLVGDNSGLPEIPSISSDLQHIKEQLTELNLLELADNAKTTLIGIQRIIGEVNGQIAPLATSLRQTSDAARVALESTTVAVRQLQDDASRTLAAIDRLANATQGQVTSTGTDLKRAMAAATQTIHHADRVIGALEDMTGRNAPLRGNFEAMVRDLAASASSLRSFTRELERNPGGAVLGRPSI